jgi:hypothetical protein
MHLSQTNDKYAEKHVAGGQSQFTKASKKKKKKKKRINMGIIRT